MLDFSNSIYYSDFLFNHVRVCPDKDINAIDDYLDSIFTLFRTQHVYLNSTKNFHFFLGVIYKYFVLRYISNSTESYSFDFIRSSFSFKPIDFTLIENRNSLNRELKLTPFCKYIGSVCMAYEGIMQIIEFLSNSEHYTALDFLRINGYSTEESKQSKSKSTIKSFSCALIELVRYIKTGNHSILSNKQNNDNLFFDMLFL